MYFELYRVKINDEVLILEDFKYGVGELSNKKRFWIRAPFGFNKSDDFIDAYPILHNLLITKEFFDMDVEINVNGEFVHFARLESCIMLDKEFAPNDMISYQFSGSFKSLTEYNEKFLEMTRKIFIE